MNSRFDVRRFTPEVESLLDDKHRNHSGVGEVTVVENGDASSDDRPIAFPVINEDERLLLRQDVPGFITDIDWDVADGCQSNNVIWRPGIFPKKCPFMFINGKLCFGKWEDLLLVEMGDGDDRTIRMSITVCPESYVFEVDFWAKRGFGSFVDITELLQTGLNKHVEDTNGTLFVKVMHTTIGIYVSGRPGWKGILKNYFDQLVPSDRFWQHDNMELRTNVPKDEPPNGRGHLIRLLSPAMISIPVVEGQLELRDRDVVVGEHCSKRPRVAKAFFVPCDE